MRQRQWRASVPEGGECVFLLHGQAGHRQAAYRAYCIWAPARTAMNFARADVKIEKLVP